MNRDLALENIIGSLEDIKKQPLVSVIVKDFFSKSFFDSLYNQSCPMFEVIVTEKAFEKLPEKYKNAENLTVVKSVKAAKKAAKAKNIIVFKKPLVLAVQTFKSVYRFGLPKRLVNLFFSIIARTLNILLTKRN